jgi:hypothetical protein
MELAHRDWAVAVAIITVWCGTGVEAESTALVVAEKEIKINVPVQLPRSLPLQLASNLKTQYSPDHSSERTVRLGKMTLEAGIQYPSLVGGVYCGNSLGETLLPSGRDSAPSISPNGAYLTTWLNKQWGSVNLSLAHIRLIDESADQLAVGVYKAVSVLQSALFLGVGAYLFNDLSTGYWSRTTDLSLDYNWKRWVFSLFVEHREESSLREQSVWTTIKTKF